MKQVIKLFRQCTSERMSRFLAFKKDFSSNLWDGFAKCNNVIINIVISILQTNSCTEQERNFDHVSDQQLKENCKKKPASSELWLLQLKCIQHCLVNGCNIVFWNAQSSPTPLHQIRNFWFEFSLKRHVFLVSSRNKFEILKFLIKVWRLLCSALCWNTLF